MPNTFELIASSTVGAGGAATISFTSIPSTYTDLCLKISSRSTASVEPWSDIIVKPNGSTSSINVRVLYGTGSATGSTSFTSGIVVQGEGNGGTANTFGNTEIYIPNYAGSNYKSFSGDSVSENNATKSIAHIGAMLWSNTAAITSLDFTDFNSGNFVQYSSFYLYGVKNA